MVVNNPHDKFLKPGTWVTSRCDFNTFITKYIEITGIDLRKNEQRLVRIYNKILYHDCYISMIVNNRNRGNKWEDCILRRTDTYGTFEEPINVPRSLLKIRRNGS